MSYLKSTIANLQSLDIGTAALLPTVIGMMLATELNSTEQEVFGNFLVDIGDTLTTISSLIDAKQEENVKDAKSDEQTDKSHTLKDDQENLQSQIDELQMQNKEIQKAMQELQKALRGIRD